MNVGKICGEILKKSRVKKNWPQFFSSCKNCQKNANFLEFSQEAELVQKTYEEFWNLLKIKNFGLKSSPVETFSKSGILIKNTNANHYSLNQLIRVDKNHVTNSDVAIVGIINYFRERSFMAILASGLIPSGLEEKLVSVLRMEKKGEKIFGMFFDFGQELKKKGGNYFDLKNEKEIYFDQKLRIRSTSENTNLIDWLSCYQKYFQLDSNDSLILLNLYQNSRASLAAQNSSSPSSPSKIINYVAYWENLPVASATLVIFPLFFDSKLRQVAGLFNFCCAEESSKKSAIHFAMSRLRLFHAFQNNCLNAVMFSSGENLKDAEKLGFRRVSQYQIFVKK